jgi:TatA/E family protein of Tat protein translocase
MFRNPLVDGAVILIVLVLFFRPKTLPMLGRGLGEGIKEFKEGVTSSGDSDTPAQLTEGPSAGAASTSESAAPSEHRS